MREGWTECTFEELTESLKRGPFGGDLKKAFFVPNGHAVYEQQHAIGNDFSNIRYFIDDERYELLSACNVGPGDYIVSCSGTMGKIARLPKNSPQGVINQALLRIRINEGIINHNYFLEFFRSSIFQKKILKDSRGSGMQNMAGIKEIKPIVVEIPPKPEQRAIVAKIEELFSDLDKGIADLKKGQDQLKVYRQAVLKKAFEGDWEMKCLGEVAKWGSGGTPSRRNSEFYTGDIPWLKTGELGEKYVSDAQEKITAEAIKKSSAKIFPKNSVGIAMYGATIGKTSIFTKALSTNQACAVAQPSDSIISEYLYYYLLSQKNDFINKGKGGAQPNISQTIIKAHPIPVPDIKEQGQIVQEIESRLSVCDKVEESITESLEKAKALRQSILKKAFEGTLLSAEEIAACKASPDYEPASVLLEKIKAEKKK